MPPNIENHFLFITVDEYPQHSFVQLYTIYLALQSKCPLNHFPIFRMACGINSVRGTPFTSAGFLRSKGIATSRIKAYDSQCSSREKHLKITCWKAIQLPWNHATGISVNGMLTYKMRITPYASHFRTATNVTPPKRIFQCNQKATKRTSLAAGLF